MGKGYRQSNSFLKANSTQKPMERFFFYFFSVLDFQYSSKAIHHHRYRKLWYPWILWSVVEGQVRCSGFPFFRTGLHLWGLISLLFCIGLPFIFHQTHFIHWMLLLILVNCGVYILITFSFNPSNLFVFIFQKLKYIYIYIYVHGYIFIYIYIYIYIYQCKYKNMVKIFFQQT